MATAADDDDVARGAAWTGGRNGVVREGISTELRVENRSPGV